MKIKVTGSFRDKYTNTLYKIGQEIEVTQKRFLEINGTSFGILTEEIKEDIKEEVKQTPKKRNTKKVGE